MSGDERQKALTPDDIVNFPLKQAVRGYSTQQVDELLDRIADQMERMTTGLDEAQTRLNRCEERLAAASETEATLKRTLVTAQRAAEQSIEDAKSRAAEILDEARREAARITEQSRLDAEELRVEALQAARAEEAEIRRRRQGLEGHIEALRLFERDYEMRLRAHLDKQLNLLDELRDRPAAAATDDDSLADLDALEADDLDLSPLTVRVREDLGSSDG